MIKPCDRAERASDHTRSITEYVVRNYLWIYLQTEDKYNLVEEHYYEAKTDFILHTVTCCSAELPTRMRTVPKGTEENQEAKEGVALRCSSPRTSYGVRQLYRV